MSVGRPPDPPRVAAAAAGDPGVNRWRGPPRDPVDSHVCPQPRQQHQGGRAVRPPPKADPSASPAVERNRPWAATSTAWASLEQHTFGGSGTTRPRGGPRGVPEPRLLFWCGSIDTWSVGMQLRFRADHLRASSPSRGYACERRVRRHRGAVYGLGGQHRHNVEQGVS